MENNLVSNTIRVEDVVISLSYEKDGRFKGMTDEQIIKSCVDILLSYTEEDSLENILDAYIGIEETLIEDFNFSNIQVFDFIRRWKHRLYLKQIGKDNEIEEKSINDSDAVEPSPDAPEPQLEHESVVIKTKSIGEHLELN